MDSCPPPPPPPAQQLEEVPQQTLAAIFHHDDCAGHHISKHPEKPSRMASILDGLRSIYPESFFRLAPAVTKEQLLLYHEPQQINNFLKLCQRAEASGRKFQIDCDTEVVNTTRLAVYRAAGSLIAAIDALFLSDNHPQRLQTAFCCTRPPGHHAERHKSMGFCFFNNAAIAAKYAISKYGESLGLLRVAVVDFDVHHGNGTEEGFSDDTALFYGSTHEYGNFPGTGSEPILLQGSITATTILNDCCTRRPDCSLDVLKKLLYLGTNEGMQDTADALPSLSECFDFSIVDKQYEVGPDDHSRRIVNRSMRSGKMSRRDFRKGWVDIVLEMLQFQPHLVIISAGFDAHINDPLADCQLTEDDFRWATYLVVESSQFCPQTLIQPQGISGCPVLSILEGGYDLSAIAESSKAHVAALFQNVPVHVSTFFQDLSSKVAASGATPKISMPLPSLYPTNFKSFDSSSGEDEDDIMKECSESLNLGATNTAFDSPSYQFHQVAENHEKTCNNSLTKKISNDEILLSLDKSMSELMSTAMSFHEKETTSYEKYENRDVPEE